MLCPDCAEYAADLAEYEAVWTKEEEAADA